MTKLRQATAALLAERHSIDLEEWVRAQRAKGATWLVVQRRLYELTGLDLTVQTLINWFGPSSDGEAA